MSLRRRTALLGWAWEAGAWIVEDDYDSEMRYAGHPFPSMQGLEPDRVVYLGTFSKVLFPSLRLGYAIVPGDLVRPFVGARILLDRHPPTADQRTLVVEVFARFLPTELGHVQPCDQGMHMVVWLRPDIDDTAVAAAAVAHGVSVRAVSPMYAPGTEWPGLLLGFGGYRADAIESAARRLVKVIKTAAGG